MLSKSFRVLLSCLVLIAAVTTGSHADAVGSASTIARNSSPLPPAGAASIKEAQGTDWSGPLLGAAVTGGIFLAILLLINDDADGPAVTSTTQ
jgi:hypothetical protein